MVGPRIMLLESQPGKQSSLETFSWDNDWTDCGVSSNYENTDKKIGSQWLHVATAVII